jgi:magnesium chelatase family protein
MVSRAARQAEFPAEFQLVAAMNPCPCGYLGHYAAKCRCTPDQVARYRARVSGPLLDRIDLQIEVPAVSEHYMLGVAQSESSETVRARVAQAAQRQRERQGKLNTGLSAREIDVCCTPDSKGVALLKHAINRLGLTARAYHRVLKVARTIADLAGESGIGSSHIAEAIQFRRFDRV